MSDAAGTAVGPVSAPSAGRLLREARERQGLHIAALAASIKVTQKKLELLEADRFDALPDATFARALALTVCRALKIDSDAVLRLLPPAGGYRLEQVGEGLNAPFRERPGVLAQRDGAGFAFGWVFWLTTLILVAAAVVYFLPPAWLDRLGWRGIVAAPGSASSAAAPQASATTARASASLAVAPPDATPLPVLPTPATGADEPRPRAARAPPRPTAPSRCAPRRRHGSKSPTRAAAPCCRAWSSPAKRSASTARRRSGSASATRRERSSAFAVNRSSSSRRATTSPASS